MNSQTFSKLPSNLTRNMERANGSTSMDEIQNGHYCLKHHKVTCPICMSSSHRSHEYGPLEVDSPMSEGDSSAEVQIGKLLSKLKRTNHELRQFRKTIDAHLTNIAFVLGDIEGSVKDAYEKKLSCIDEEHRRRDAHAQLEAADQIRRINERLHLRLAQHRKEADAKYKLVRRDTDALFVELRQYSRDLSTIPNSLRDESWQRSSRLLELSGEIEQMRDAGRQSNATLTTAVTTATDVNLPCTNVLEKLSGILRRIHFSEDDIRGRHMIGSLRGGRGEWGLIGTIDLRSSVRLPLLAGSISQSKVVVTDVMKRSLYVVDIETHQIVPAIHSSSLACVSDCTTLDDEVIVCGNSSNSSVDLSSMSWKHRRVVRLQNNLAMPGDPVHICVDYNGNILAAIYGQQYLYVIHATRGILRTVTLANRTPILDIHALASGGILVQSGKNRFTILDDHFQEKRIIQRPQWEKAQCTVDCSTDLLYVTFKEARKDHYAVDVLLPDGDVLSDRILEFPAALSADSSPRSHCLESGTLVVCDGAQLSVYRKMLGVEDVRMLERLPHFQADKLPHPRTESVTYCQNVAEVNASHDMIDGMVSQPAKDKVHIFTEYYV